MYRLPVLLVLLLQSALAADMPTVGRIVVFGDLHLESKVRALFPAVPVALREEDGERLHKRLTESPLWQQSDMSWVCCEAAGTAILYVGVREKRRTLPVRTAPTGSVRLDAQDLQVYERLMELNHEAVTQGRSGEGQSAGHSLGSYQPVRTLQEQVIARAAERRMRWRAVALGSSDRLHRAAAVHLLPYGPKDEALAQVLAAAAQDSDALVRNNAVRAIGVLAMSDAGRALLRLQPGPLLDLFESVHWTDWNKASFALVGLTETGDAQLLTEIAKRAAEPLRQIARWPAMHAEAAEKILERISRVPQPGNPPNR